MSGGRILATGLILVSLAGVAHAQPSGLTQTLDQQQRELERQRSELQRGNDAQQRALQQQQESTLQQELQRLPLQRPLICTRVGATVACQ